VITTAKILLIGIGATLAVDAWTFILGLFKVSSLDYRYVGRWIGGFPGGIFVHKNIMAAKPVRREAVIGWTAHYLIGISFAFLLVMVYGETWLADPVIFPPLLIGIVTAGAPLFIMQPAFGFGWASSRLPHPNLRRLKSLMTHIVYGLGLYASALLIARL
jgi:hypothetical protein